MKLSSSTKWIVAAVFFLLVALACLGLFLKQHYVSTGDAIEAGARVEINLKTGEVRQALLKEEMTSEPPVEDSSVEEKSIENPKPELPAEPEAMREEKPAQTEEKPDVVGSEMAAEATKKAAPEIKQTGPRIAIVITGVGLSRSSTEQAAKLSSEITFSYSPYAADLGGWMKAAEAQNREAYIDLPMEPQDYPYTDPGPLALLTGLNEEQNLERLMQLLDRAEGFRGVVVGPGERYTESARSHEALINALKQKKLIFSYVARPANHHLAQQAEKLELPIIGIDRVLDGTISSDAIDRALEDVESLAKKSGFAVALARPYPITVQRLKEWSKALSEKGISLVPLSHVRPLKEGGHDSH